MIGESKGRSLTSLIGSLTVHAAVAACLLSAPAMSQKRFSPVDMEVVQTRKAPVPPPPPPPENKEPEPEKPEPTRPKVRPAEPPPPPPSEPPPPEDKPKAKPTFDLGDNTFAAESGQGAGWALARSEGNTKLAGVAQPGDESKRGTAADHPQEEPGGTGKEKAPAWVPLKDLTRKPEPEGGGLTLPPYPRLAKENNVEGVVSLQLFIDEIGVVRNVRVIKDPGFGTAEAAREQALRQKFRPALDRKGQAVPTVIVVSYRFVLED